LAMARAMTAIPDRRTLAGVTRWARRCPRGHWARARTGWATIGGWGARRAEGGHP
jgi:hypothetical protein